MIEFQKSDFRAILRKLESEFWRELHWLVQLPHNTPAPELLNI